jgi:anti-sigma factor RsiW
MNCNDFNAIIDSFLDKELNDREVAEFELHFTSCEKCRNELESFEKTSQILRYVLRDVNPPISIKDIVFRKIDGNN